MTEEPSIFETVIVWYRRHIRYTRPTAIIMAIVLVGWVSVSLSAGARAFDALKMRLVVLTITTSMKAVEGVPALTRLFPGASPAPQKASNLSKRLRPDGPSMLFGAAYSSPCEADDTCEVTRPISPDLHNIDGAWRNFVVRLTARPNVGQREDGLAPYNEEGEKRVRNIIKMDAGGTPVAPSEMYGRPEGTAKDIALMHVLEILQTPDRIYMVYDDRTETRTIYLDRPHPENLVPTYMGHSVGHWEGDTLVVDTIGFNDETWLDFSGSPHGKQLHMIERYRKTHDGERLENEVTFDDPEFYTRPFELHLVYEWRPKTYALERFGEPFLRAVIVDGLQVQ